MFPQRPEVSNPFSQRGKHITLKGSKGHNQYCGAGSLPRSTPFVSLRQHKRRVGTRKSPCWELSQSEGVPINSRADVPDSQSSLPTTPGKGGTLRNRGGWSVAIPSQYMVLSRPQMAGVSLGKPPGCFNLSWDRESGSNNWLLVLTFSFFPSLLGCFGWQCEGEPYLPMDAISSRSQFLL